MSRQPLLITQLGYVGIEATDIEEWRRYACDFLGMQVVDVGANTLHLRMDERPFRLFVTRGDRDGLACMGLEVRDASALDDLSARLATASTSIQRGSEQECRTRRVAALNWFRDPDGNRIELFHGPLPECRRVHSSGRHRRIPDRRPRLGTRSPADPEHRGNERVLPRAGIPSERLHGITDRCAISAHERTASFPRATSRS